MSMERYKCKNCGWTFNLNMYGTCDSVCPIYCPHCGKEWEIKETLIGIIEEIKRLYHKDHPNIEISNRESKMEKLFKELKEMTEANK